MYGMGILRGGLGILAALSLAATTKKDVAPVRAAQVPLRVLVVGGGPDPRHNQVAIESNVRYVERLLPKGSPTTTLFANGTNTTKNVQVETDGHTKYVAPDLAHIDGPADLRDVTSATAALASPASSQDPILLYFTGHGGPDERSEYNNNEFDLWNGDELSVQQLAKSIDSLPTRAPIVVVMVQCFSGAFGNLIFQNGNPTQALAQQRICGFFAAVGQREAAGCTPEINEADYRDFTGYFFAALTGVSRMNQPVTGADYNHDGKVGMNEAFAYSLINDDSIDTPVCTSDVFLRRFVGTSDEAIFETPYRSVLSWAAPEQGAVLRALSSQLGLSGDDRLTKAYAAFERTNPESMRPEDVRLIRFVRTAKTVVLQHTLTTSGNSLLKQRFAELKQLEAANPLRP